MPGSLIDTNVWIAALFSSHPFHGEAREILNAANSSTPAVFCRSTQQSFLRLASTPTVLKAYGAERMTNRDALAALEAFLTVPSVRDQPEPVGTFALWSRLALRDTASPKTWMDAYLAAFAISGGLRLVTLDGDFKGYKAKGLDLRLVNS